MAKRLYLTEKPSQIVALKQAIKGRGNSYVPLAGHLLKLHDMQDYDKSFGNWHKSVVSNKLPFFPEEFKKKVSPISEYTRKDGTKASTNYQKLFNDVKREIERCDEIVIAADPDNEGASLALEVIKACDAEYKIVGMMNMAATDPVTLKKSLAAMESGEEFLDYVSMAEAADTRARFDWLFGMNLTVASSVALGKGETLHMGGVKLPTVRMVVERDHQFENTDEQFYWKLKGIAKDPISGKEFPVTIKHNGKDRIEKEDVAKELLKKVSSSVDVSKYKEENKKSIPPKPFSLLDMQSSVSSSNGLSMTRSENAAQGLYDKGLQSYPRTEERSYSSGEHKRAKSVINGLEGNGLFQGMKPLDTPLKKRFTFNDKALVGKAHGALSPTVKAVNIDSLSPDERTVYQAVSKRYYAQFMDDYKYQNTSLSAKDGEFTISASENIQKEKGWKELIPMGLDSIEATIPSLEVGSSLNIVSLELEKGSIKPKPRFTEISLAQAMQRIATIYDDEEVKEHLGENGIGTPATRKKIINDLKNGYFDLTNGKLISTIKSRDFISILPDQVTSPILRAKLESMTTDIAAGKGDFNKVKGKIEETISEMYASILDIGKEQNIPMYDKEKAYSAPTQKQIDFVKKLSEKNGLTLPENINTCKETMHKWIDSHQDKMVYTLSDKQLDVLAETKNPEVKKLLKKDSFNKEEFVKIQEEIKVRFKEIKADYRFNISDKQRAVLENPDNDVPAPTLKLISEKTEFTQREYNRINKVIKEVFASNKGYKKDFRDR